MAKSKCFSESFSFPTSKNTALDEKMDFAIGGICSSLKGAPQAMDAQVDS
jgi:hypothetical protein